MLTADSCEQHAPLQRGHRSCSIRESVIVNHLQGPVLSPFAGLSPVKFGGLDLLLLEHLVLRATVGQLAPMLGEIVERQPLGQNVRCHGRRRHVRRIEHPELDALLAEHRAHRSGTGMVHRRGVASHHDAPGIVDLYARRLGKGHTRPLAV